jgi:hypothetical protein
MSKIVFLINPINHGMNLSLELLPTLLNYNIDNKINFRFGFSQGVDLIGTVKPFNRIRETIKEHRLIYPETTLVYCGWELLECLDDLYKEFEQAEFFITTKKSMPSCVTKAVETTLEVKLYPSDKDVSAIIKEKIEYQITKINHFLEGKDFKNFKEDSKFFNTSLFQQGFEGIYILNEQR